MLVINGILEMSMHIDGIIRGEREADLSKNPWWEADIKHKCFMGCKRSL